MYMDQNSPVDKTVRANDAQAPSAWRLAAIETLLVLRTKFPQCFARLDLRSRAPIKVGINADIVAALPDLPAVDVGRALKFYVGQVSYLAHCTEGKSRVDLDGQPAGAVTASEAEHARNLLARLAKRQKQKPQAASTLAPTPPLTPKRLTLAALKEAAAKRRLLEVNGATAAIEEE